MGGAAMGGVGSAAQINKFCVYALVQREQDERRMAKAMYGLAATACMIEGVSLANDTIKRVQDHLRNERSDEGRRVIQWLAKGNIHSLLAVSFVYDDATMPEEQQKSYFRLVDGFIDKWGPSVYQFEGLTNTARANKSDEKVVWAIDKFRTVGIRGRKLTREDLIDG